MSRQKCEDCITKISLKKTVSLIVSVVLFASGIVFGLANIYFRFETVEKNQVELVQNVKVIADHLKKTGAIPENSCFNDTDTTKIYFADISKPSGEDKDDKRRISNTETTSDSKDFEHKITR